MDKYIFFTAIGIAVGLLISLLVKRIDNTKEFAKACMNKANDNINNESIANDLLYMYWVGYYDCAKRIVKGGDGTDDKP